MSFKYVEAIIWSVCGRKESVGDPDLVVFVGDNPGNFFRIMWR